LSDKYVSNQLVSLASREKSTIEINEKAKIAKVSNQLVSLASRELVIGTFKDSGLQVSNQLVSLASRERTQLEWVVTHEQRQFPIN
jgi:hypothetical protein